MKNAEHGTMWCLFLFAFLLMARKSNLVPMSKCDFDPSKILLRKNIFVGQDVIIVLIKYTKTIQFRERQLRIPVLSIPGSPLCPFIAYKDMCKLIPASGNNPAFCLPSLKSVVPVTLSVSKLFEISCI